MICGELNRSSPPTGGLQRKRQHARAAGNTLKKSIRRLPCMLECVFPPQEEQQQGSSRGHWRQFFIYLVAIIIVLLFQL
jgi:hypothetical protein